MIDTARATEMVLWAEHEDRFWRARGEEPSQLVKDILAIVPRLEAAGIVPRRRYVARKRTA